VKKAITEMAYGQLRLNVESNQRGVFVFVAFGKHELPLARGLMNPLEGS
jgi:hypothetical protein